jgi:cyclic pyranopterin phosphate synthase
VLLEKHLPDLVSAGVKRINVSLDSLDASTFADLTRFDKLNDVKRGIEAAKRAGIRIRLNAVVLNEVNNKDVRSLVEYALRNTFDIAFIEEMPLGHIDSHARADTLTATDAILSELSKSYRLTPEEGGESLSSGPARYWTVDGYKSRVGFISPHSNNFCGDCNRVRVTVEGQLLLCLGHSDAVDLRSVLRATDYHRDRLKETIVSAMQLKPKQHYFDPEDTQIVRFMSATGG